MQLVLLFSALCNYSCYLSIVANLAILANELEVLCIHRKVYYCIET